jgi:excisionase family DNA binding protein
MSRSTETVPEELLAREALPALRFDIIESATILRISRALLYRRIAAGAIKAQRDGARRYISAAELQRYVASCDEQSAA